MNIISAHPFKLLTIVTLVMHFAGLFAMPVLDRDEARFAQATAQMLESGNFVEINFQDEPRNKKPIGVHWFQAVFVGMLTDSQDRTVWPYRIPSLLGALAAVLFTFWGGRQIFNEDIGFLAALFLSSTLVLAGEATIAKTDAVLLACITASQLALARIYMSAHVPAGQHANKGMFSVPSLPQFVLWLGLALGILVKGPVAPLLFLLTAGTLTIIDRNVRWLFGTSPIWGAAILAIVTLPWTIAISSASGTSFFSEAFLGDIGPKVVGGQESHGFWPGTYLLAAWVLLWPASLYLMPALRSAWLTRNTLGIKFCLAWIIPFWIVFELIPTKLPHYVLPTFPAIALLSAVYVYRYVNSIRHSNPHDDQIIRWVNSVIWLGIGVLIAASIAFLPPFHSAEALEPVFYGACAIAVGSLIIYILHILNRHVTASLALVVLATVTFYSLLSFTLPALTNLQVSHRLEKKIDDWAEKQGLEDRPRVVASGYSEPSMVFLLGTETQLGPADVAAQAIASDPGVVAVVEKEHQRDFQKAIEIQGVAVEKIDEVEGFNYSRGKTVVLSLYRQRLVREQAELNASQPR